MTVGMIEIIGTIAITDKTFIQSKHRPAYLKLTGDLQSDLVVAGFFSHPLRLTDRQPVHYGFLQ